MTAILMAATLLSVAPAGALTAQGTASVDAQTAPGPPLPDYRPLDPARLADTRPGRSTWDGQAAGSGLVTPQAPLVLSVGGRGGVPNAPVVVSLNVTATGTTAAGFFTVHPAGQARPTASNVNYDRGQTVANSVVAQLGTSNRIVIYSSAPAHVIVDVTGYWTSTGITSVAPARLADTRPGRTTVDGQFSGIGPRSPDAPLQLTVTGRSGTGVPASGVSAVALNVTVTAPSASGFLTVYPGGTSRPGTSNLNYAKGQTVANGVISKVGAGGRVDLYSSAPSTHLIVDIAGYFTDGAGYVPLEPRRFADTRPNSSTVNGRPGPFTSGRDSARVGQIGTSAPNGPQIDVLISGRGGVPRADVGAVVLNVTVVQPTTAGYLTVFPLDSEPPNASSVNFAAGRTVPNLVVAKLGRGGGVSVFSSAARSQIIIDVLGYFPGLPTDDVPGAYAALALDDIGMPVSYDRCFEIPFQINPAGSSESERSDVQSALDQVSFATGIVFDYVGATNEVPKLPRDPVTPGGNLKPLLIAWPTSTQVPALSGGVVGVGGSSIFAAGDSVRWIPEQFFTGIAYFQRNHGLAPGFATGNSFGQLALHELGHAVGLDHVSNDVEIMHPTLINRPWGYGAGDLAGLSLLYRTQSCPWSPATYGAGGIVGLRSGQAGASATPSAVTADERTIPMDGGRWTDAYEEGRADGDHGHDEHDDDELWRGPWTRFQSRS